MISQWRCRISFLPPPLFFINPATYICFVASSKLSVYCIAARYSVIVFDELLKIRQRDLPFSAFFDWCANSCSEMLRAERKM